MGRSLMTLGAILLLLTLSLWIGDAVGLLATATATSWSLLTLKSGLAVLALGLFLRLAAPVTHQLGRGRCTVCGNPVERGHTYCMDHLQETVNAYRDQTRERMLRDGKNFS